MNTRKRKLADISGGPVTGRQPLTKRRRTPLFELLSFLDHEIRKGPRFETQKRVGKPSPFSILKKSKATKVFLRKEHSEAMQALVIFLRFGSLADDRSRWLPAIEVFKRTGVMPCSQHKIISRWKQRGFLIYKEKRKGKQQVLTPEQVRWITDINTLQSMTHMSLRKRSQLIRDKFDLPSFYHSTLREYYIRHGVKYKKPDYKFWKSNAENLELQKKQMEFVQELGSMI